jgi:hypothetical protein
VAAMKFYKDSGLTSCHGVAPVKFSNSAGQNNCQDFSFLAQGVR